MEALVVGGLTAFGVSFAVFFWFLLVRPDVMLGGLGSGALNKEGWYDIHPGLLLLVRVLSGLVLFVLGFFVGFGLIFLSGTNW